MPRWFENDISAEERKHLNAFFRVNVNSRNIQQMMLEACYGSVKAIGGDDLRPDRLAAILRPLV